MMQSLKKVLKHLNVSKGIGVPRFSCAMMEQGEEIKHNYLEESQLSSTFCSTHYCVDPSLECFFALNCTPFCWVQTLTEVCMSPSPPQFFMSPSK